MKICLFLFHLLILSLSLYISVTEMYGDPDDNMTLNYCMGLTTRDKEALLILSCKIVAITISIVFKTRV